MDETAETYIYLCSNRNLSCPRLASGSFAGTELCVWVRPIVCHFSAWRRTLLNRARKTFQALYRGRVQSRPVGKNLQRRIFRVVNCQRRNGKRLCPDATKTASHRCFFYYTKTGLLRKPMLCDRVVVATAEVGKRNNRVLFTDGNGRKITARVQALLTTRSRLYCVQ